MNSVKMTIVICLTVVVMGVLFISYNEYINRYKIVSNADNSVYIFDQKTNVLNHCEKGGCKLLEPIFPQSNDPTPSTSGQSALFQDNSMVNSVNNNTVTAEKTTEHTDEASADANKNSTEEKDKTKNEGSKNAESEVKKSDSEENNSKNDQTKGDKKSGNGEKQNNDKQHSEKKKK